MRLDVRYHATLDRAGLALGAGSGLVGLAIVIMLLSGGQRDPLALVVGWLIGSVFAAIAMTALGGPIWLVMHVAGLRRGRHAALVAGVGAAALFVGARTGAFGLFAAPRVDGDVGLVRWVSALLTGATSGVIAAGIAAIMWRIAYRRSFDS